MTSMLHEVENLSNDSKIVVKENVQKLPDPVLQKKLILEEIFRRPISDEDITRLKDYLATSDIMDLMRKEELEFKLRVIEQQNFTNSIETPFYIVSKPYVTKLIWTEVDDKFKMLTIPELARNPPFDCYHNGVLLKRELITKNIVSTYSLVTIPHPDLHYNIDHLHEHENLDPIVGVFRELVTRKTGLWTARDGFIEEVRSILNLFVRMMVLPQKESGKRLLISIHQPPAETELTYHHDFAEFSLAEKLMEISNALKMNNSKDMIGQIIRGIFPHLSTTGTQVMVQEDITGLHQLIYSKGYGWFDVPKLDAQILSRSQAMFESLRVGFIVIKDWFAHCPNPFGTLRFEVLNTYAQDKYIRLLPNVFTTYVRQFVANPYIEYTLIQPYWNIFFEGQTFEYDIEADKVPNAIATIALSTMETSSSAERNCTTLALSCSEMIDQSLKIFMCRGVVELHCIDDFIIFDTYLDRISLVHFLCLYSTTPLSERLRAMLMMGLFDKLKLKLAGNDALIELDYIDFQIGVTRIHNALRVYYPNFEYKCVPRTVRDDAAYVNYYNRMCGIVTNNAGAQIGLGADHPLIKLIQLILYATPVWLPAHATRVEIPLPFSVNPASEYYTTMPTWYGTHDPTHDEVVLSVQTLRPVFIMAMMFTADIFIYKRSIHIMKTHFFKWGTLSSLDVIRNSFALNKHIGADFCNPLFAAEGYRERFRYTLKAKELVSMIFSVRKPLVIPDNFNKLNTIINRNVTIYNNICSKLLLPIQVIYIARRLLPADLSIMSSLKTLYSMFDDGVTDVSTFVQSLINVPRIDDLNAPINWSPFGLPVQVLNPNHYFDVALNLYTTIRDHDSNMYGYGMGYYVNIENVESKLVYDRITTNCITIRRIALFDSNHNIFVYQDGANYVPIDHDMLVICQVDYSDETAASYFNIVDIGAGPIYGVTYIVPYKTLKTKEESYSFISSYNMTPFTMQDSRARMTLEVSYRTIAGVGITGLKGRWACSFSTAVINRFIDRGVWPFFVEMIEKGVRAYFDLPVCYSFEVNNDLKYTPEYILPLKRIVSGDRFCIPIVCYSNFSVPLHPAATSINYDLYSFKVRPFLTELPIKLLFTATFRTAHGKRLLDTFDIGPVAHATYANEAAANGALTNLRADPIDVTLASQFLLFGGPIKTNLNRPASQEIVCSYSWNPSSYSIDKLISDMETGSHH